MVYYLTELFLRFHVLLIKLMSVKIIVFGIATWLVLEKVLPPYLWFMCALAVLSFRTFEKRLGGHSDPTRDGDSRQTS